MIAHRLLHIFKLSAVNCAIEVVIEQEKDLIEVVVEVLFPPHEFVETREPVCLRQPAVLVAEHVEVDQDVQPRALHAPRHIAIEFTYLLPRDPATPVQVHHLVHLDPHFHVADVPLFEVGQKLVVFEDTVAVPAARIGVGKLKH